MYLPRPFPLASTAAFPPWPQETVLAASFLSTASPFKCSLFRKHSCPWPPACHSDTCSIIPLCFILLLWHFNYLILFGILLFVWLHVFYLLSSVEHQSMKAGIFLFGTLLNYCICKNYWRVSCVRDILIKWTKWMNEYILCIRKGGSETLSN